MASLPHNKSRFAMLGFSITALFVAYQLLTNAVPDVPKEPAMMIFFVVVCPPSLLSVVLGPEVGSGAFYVVWIVIGILNGALYATIVALLNRRKKSADSTGKLPS